MPLPLRYCAAGLAFSLLLAGQAIAQTAPEKQLEQKVYAIPFTPVPGRGAPLVTVWINKSQTATFVVDTGTNDCTISQSLVEKLGLPSYPALHSDHTPIFFGGKQAQAVTLASLKIGGEKGQLDINPLNGPIVVAPDEYLRVSADRTVDGVIGIGLLDNFAVFFNFPSRMMTFCLPGKLTSAQARYFGCDATGGVTLLLSEDVHGTYTVPVRLENNSISLQANLLVDTGAQLTAVPHDAALDLSLRPLHQIAQTGGTEGYHTVDTAQVQVLSFGSLQLTNPTVTYSTGTDHSPGVGMDILSGYKVLLDFPAKKMYLQPIGPAVKIGPPLNIPPPASEKPGL